MTKDLREEISKELREVVDSATWLWQDHDSYDLNLFIAEKVSDVILSTPFLRKLIDGGAVGVDKEQLWRVFAKTPLGMTPKNIDYFVEVVDSNAAKIIKPKEAK